MFTKIRRGHVIIRKCDPRTESYLYGVKIQMNSSVLSIFSILLSVNVNPGVLCSVVERSTSIKFLGVPSHVSSNRPGEIGRQTVWGRNIGLIRKSADAFGCFMWNITSADMSCL